MRALLGGLAALSLVVVASALSRMWAYEQAYGFTQMRLLVSAFELWLGVVFLLVIVAGATGGMSAEPGRRAAWLPSAVLGTGIAALIALAALNPDRFIADQNVTRYEETGRIDLEYLSSLSADAVPALYRLPAELQPCVLGHIARDLTAAGPDSWNEWNLGRAEARRLLADYDVPFAGAVARLPESQHGRPVTGPYVAGAPPSSGRPCRRTLPSRPWSMRVMRGKPRRWPCGGSSNGSARRWRSRA